ncbi:glycogen-binding domain-containing protein [Flaviaesturariibacter amylovorans]
MTHPISPAASWLRLLLTLLLSVAVFHGYAQDPPGQCTVRDQRMYIELRKDMAPPALFAFIEKYGLEDLALDAFLKRNMQDSLRRRGWVVERNNAKEVILYRPLFAGADIGDPAQRLHLTAAPPEPVPVSSFGANRFRNKAPFTNRDSLVTFYLRGQTRAGNVLLAGSFTDWQNGALRMQKVDSGWIAQVRLAPGKYWYKFIVDGGWQVDADNLQQENDGRGNTNSVYFRPNRVFRLEGHAGARSVFLAGSFNNWRKDALALHRYAGGWILPVYLGEGTHLYKFVVDGQWLHDPANPDRMPDGHSGFNSVLRNGKPVHFNLAGFPNAKAVALAGNFNGWRGNEIFLTRTATGWTLPFVLGGGTYEYKFIVDGRWIADPANPLNTGGNGKGNSVLVVAPNHTFRLKGYAAAKNVAIGGDFNGWNKQSLPLRREGDDWVLALHLHPGKHRYKFYVDDKWILDPGNKLWEQNEFRTGNSVLWKEPIPQPLP